MNAVAALVAIAKMDIAMKLEDQPILEEAVVPRTVTYFVRKADDGDIFMSQCGYPFSEKEHASIVEQRVMNSPKGILKWTMQLSKTEEKKEAINSADIPKLSRRVSWNADIPEDGTRIGHWTSEKSQDEENRNAIDWNTYIPSMVIPKFRNLKKRKKEPKRLMASGKARPLPEIKRARPDVGQPVPSLPVFLILPVSAVQSAPEVTLVPVTVQEGWRCPGCTLPNLLEVGRCINPECRHLKPTTRKLVKVPL